MNNKKAERTPDEEKNKIPISVYISSGTLEDLEDCLFSVKRRLPIDKRAKLSKSTFCEIGLRIAIEEYNRTGENSELWKVIKALID
jgi:hypothetical protein